MALIRILIVLLLLVLAPVQAAFQSQIPSHAVVLMYHRFGQTTLPSTNIRMDQFTAHLTHLQANGYKVWALQRIVDHLKHHRNLPDRVVAITIDDAYRSILTHAYPLLKANHMPFTVFVAADNIDKGFSAFLNWDEMRELGRDPQVTFANHSASHDHLTQRRSGEDETAWRQRIRADILRGKRRLTEELGTPPPLFAYPYGEYDHAVAELIDELELTAFGQHSGAVGEHSDLRALPRFPMSERYGTLPQFITKVASLPLPVTAQQPWDPNDGDAATPTLTLTLGLGNARLEQLSCFVSSPGTAQIQWLDKAGRRLAITTDTPLTKGRNRYNCTAPSTIAERFYWFSQLWMR